jgi:hypothetical protein
VVVKVSVPSLATVRAPGTALTWAWLSSRTLIVTVSISVLAVPVKPAVRAMKRPSNGQGKIVCGVGSNASG